MDSKVVTTARSRQISYSHSLVKRTFVLLLLLSVPSLATLARTNWYLPQSNPGHYLTPASKTKVVSCSIEFGPAQLGPIAGAAPPKFRARAIRRAETVPAVPWTDFPVSLQHRPPPSC
jgi:hypothetical protein